ncbi:MAG TPA: hypothetical protein PLL39_13660, partial [Rhodocyclaceae bacterium]|nr:hypothetical protein [Rhodocyclaceae bacterium]
MNPLSGHGYLNSHFGRCDAHASWGRKREVDSDCLKNLFDIGAQAPSRDIPIDTWPRVLSRLSQP